MKQIVDFARRFGVTLDLDDKFIVRKAGRFFLLNKKLCGSVSNDFFYAGTYLGKTKGDVFFPSFSLLTMIAEESDTSKVMIDDKSEWLFICGRDVFFQGIKKVSGSIKKGELTLVLNKFGECIGFGKMMRDSDEMQDRWKQKVAVKNISDVGDFLRRERH